MRWLLCALVWAVGMTGALYVASETKVGPLVVRLSRNHGVHLGDLVAVGTAAAIGVAATTAALLTRPR